MKRPGSVIFFIGLFIPTDSACRIVALGYGQTSFPFFSPLFKEFANNVLVPRKKSGSGRAFFA